MYRQPGEICMLRYRKLGPVTFALPVRIVEDGPNLTALYLAAGTPIKARAMLDGTPIPRDLPYLERQRLPVVVGERTWRVNDVLILVRPGEAHDFRLYWNAATGVLRGWYVNLQDPLQRVRVGFDTADHVLDLDVSPDLRWRWKDEHEFADALSIGRFTSQEAAAIRAEGERVIADIEARHWPFDAGYEQWRPDPSWEIPNLPSNWDYDDVVDS
jgi:hypothetical protein